MKKLNSFLIIGAVIWIALANGVRIPEPLMLIVAIWLLIKALWALAMACVRSQARRDELKKRKAA